MQFLRIETFKLMKSCKSRSIAKLVEITALRRSWQASCISTHSKPVGRVWLRGRTKDVQGNALPSSDGDVGGTIVDAGNLGGARRPSRAEQQQIEILEKS